MPGLYIPRTSGNFWQMGQQHAQSAIGAYGGQYQRRKATMNPPSKTVGGGLMAGMGGAAAGYSLGGAIGESGLFAGSGAAAEGSAAGGLVAGGAAGGAGEAVAAGAGGAAGGAATAGGSAAAAGGATGSMAGPYGALIGAGIGIIAYLLS